jgi:lipopolysaccharide biosynthesis glycosyltransferase
MIRVFIGYDSREPAAFTVCVHSLIARASRPVSIAPIKLDQLDGVITRPRHPLQSTEFSFARFLTPWLCDYRGWALFIDGDMVVLDDIAALWALRDERYAVMVVKQRHEPAAEHKFLDQPQTRYARKNWSSVMLMNNALCRRLTPDYVNTASGLDLHQFQWLASAGGAEALIGELPPRWNYLVGSTHQPPSDPPPAILHYTEGGPYFPDYTDCALAECWRRERDAALHAAQPPAKPRAAGTDGQ